MTMLSTSPDRGRFAIDKLNEKLATGETNLEHAMDMIKYINDDLARRREQERDPAWQAHNLEYDLRSTEWICEKVRNSEVYAQNLYAAMCNRDFQRNDVWPVLKNQRWSCSWRRAGGIVADMQQKGDYIDWYCSGIRDQDAPCELYVSEGTVTDEVRADLLRLGWIVLDDDFE